MEDDPHHNIKNTKLPAEKASIEAILTAMETTVTSDGLLHIANCVEANLSDAIANPHHSDDSSQYIIDLHEIMDEVRSRYAQTREREIDLEANRLKERLNSWGVIQKSETQFTPVKGKNKARKSADSQAAKKPRTEDASYNNRFSSLTIEEDERETEMDAGKITPMPSPTKSQKRSPRPATNNQIPRRQMAPPITIDNKTTRAIRPTTSVHQPKRRPRRRRPKRKAPHMEPTVKELNYIIMHKATTSKSAHQFNPQEYPIASKILLLTFVSPKGLTRSPRNPFQRYPATTTQFYLQSILTTSRKIISTPSNSQTGTLFNYN
ncbi:hypothetical protein NPIL_330861 [Nephila pilipes]|uniref:Uncharacterized protein n=1 Tax=Nephila pilipes TaxID=299642 RepID=A0A8X6UCL1_NEPPI|nr:hypothetical protein NPIL_330861 [Nephila pilipes]